MEQDKKATADTLRKSYAIKKMDAENDIATCRGDLNKVYSSEPEEKTCPACGCILNEEEIENFNELKETKIEKIKELIAQLEKNRDDAAAKELAQAEASSESTKKILDLKRELGEAVQLEMEKEKELEEARKNKLAVDGTKSSEIRAEIAKVEEQAKDCEERESHPNRHERSTNSQSRNQLNSYGERRMRRPYSKNNKRRKRDRS